jgi:hypothetical protein
MSTTNEHAIQTERTNVRRRGETVPGDDDRRALLPQESPEKGRGPPPGPGRDNPPCWLEEGSIDVITKVSITARNSGRLRVVLRRLSGVKDPLYPSSSAPRRKILVIENPTISADQTCTRRFSGIFIQFTQIMQSFVSYDANRGIDPSSQPGSGNLG